MKILIVDDDADLLALVGFALTQAGYVVVKAADARTAVARFDAELPDLAILSCNRIHTNHSEPKEGFAVALHINQPIKQSK